MSDTHALSPDSIGDGDLHAAVPLEPSEIPRAPDLQGPLSLADPHTLLALIERGLAPNADETTRAAARDLWSRLAVVLAHAVPAPMRTPVELEPAPSAPMPPPSMPPGSPAMPAVPGPASPLGAAVRSLRQLPPDQLLALLIGRLQAALPAGTPVATPRGIQFPLVPVAGHPPVNGAR